MAFGVITVLGPPDAGQIEVATFRRDAEYRDGRHPEGVFFSSAEEDAQRRDFTINGLFFDPVAGQVIDFVGGQEDLAARRLRAIGNPAERFQEDKLRLLRAVRFAAALELAIDPETFDAVRRMAPQITVVSPERIAAEMRRMLEEPHRVRAMRLLILETPLAEAILGELVPVDPAARTRIDETLAVLAVLERPQFPLALAALLCRSVDAHQAETICQRWRLSNKETSRVTWLVRHDDALVGAQQTPWSVLQPILAADGAGDLVNLAEATAEAGLGDAAEAAWCREVLARPRDVLNPPPLLTGNDLLALGIHPGPAIRSLLEQVRKDQLDGKIASKGDALRLADRLSKK